MIAIIQKVNIKKIYEYSIYIYTLNIVLLIGLFLWGKEINGTKAWYSIFNINIQPSEIMKISLILINSHIIYKFYKNKSKIKFKEEVKLIICLLITLLIPSILTFLEPDTGSVISYIIITLSMFYISSINKNWFIFFSIAITLLIFIFSIIYFINPEIIINIFGISFIYRIQRIIDWKNKNGMQLNNSLIAIGSSGVTGHNYIPIYYPEAGTDFIFTSFISSYGLIAALFLIVIILLFDIYILDIFKKTNNRESKYILFGICVLFFYQQIQSIGMSIGILPITGITFPLISYGGSSLLSYLMLIGIVENIKKYNKKAYYK